jgi:type I restriction enzyme R subunit
VDFADIKQEFDDTNKEYFDELQEELGDEYRQYADMFKNSEEIKKEIEEIKEFLFRYNIDNLEEFSRQITSIGDRQTVLSLKKILENARNLCNIIRQNEHTELVNQLDYHRIQELYRLVNDRLSYLNMLETLENNVEAANIVNMALEDIEFVFEKTESSEMIIADRFRDQMVRTRSAMQECFDKKDPAYIALYEELERIFKKKKLSDIGSKEISENIMLLKGIYDKITEINRRNNLLKAKYDGDKKYVRIHKRILERSISGAVRESIINKALLRIKESTDEKLINNRDYLSNESYFEQMLMPFINAAFNLEGIKMDVRGLKDIDYLVAAEYLNEYRGEIA